jgi:hypothetical protein
MSERHSETAFETVIETHLLANGYATMNRDGFDRQRAVFPEAVLAFIRATQPREWVNQEAGRTATDHTILLHKERRTVHIASAVSDRKTIDKSTGDTLLGQWGGIMRC